MLEELGLASALLIGMFIAAFAADAPAATSVKPAIPKSDRWFRYTNTDPKVKGFLHIGIKASGDTDTPIRIVYEHRYAVGDIVYCQAFDSLCMNDEWLSPVRMTWTVIWPRSRRGEGMNGEFTNGQVVNGEYTITRPDQKSTAGKLVDDLRTRELDIKERTVLYFTPLELVSRFPFEKDKSLDFATVEYFSITGTSDCRLSYVGEEEIEVNGQKRNLHKCVLSTGERNIRGEFWLTAKHELVRARLESTVLTTTTEAEARKPVADAEARMIGPENAERMSEGISGCGTIRTAMGIRFAQYNAYPTLDGVAGDQLEATLHIAPTDLDGKYFKAAGYVVNSTAKGYTVKATLGAQTYVIDEKGVESGTFRTK